MAERKSLGVRLTATAYAHGLALTETVEMARPTGVRRAGAINIRIPVEGADWLTSSESA